MATGALFQQKAAIRKDILEKRTLQDPAICVEKSSRIIRTLLSRKEFQKAAKILIYLSKEGEVGVSGTFSLGPPGPRCRG